ncbi:hypothetical protein [Pseudonocardia sp. Ae717_Ps2]|uniref:hypothetical protein n=1 Tax=Pseudonocardia sp. Ae717_Ps2 TaxID=1885573 RepID=UPI00117B22EC|nr:hypothetical protein [Pseudonocardia sp. Ae717_Ps2]
MGIPLGAQDLPGLSPVPAGPQRLLAGTGAVRSWPDHPHEHDAYRTCTSTVSLLIGSSSCPATIPSA